MGVASAAASVPACFWRMARSLPKMNSISVAMHPQYHPLPPVKVNGWSLRLSPHVEGGLDLRYVADARAAVQLSGVDLCSATRANDSFNPAHLHAFFAAIVAEALEYAARRISLLGESPRTSAAHPAFPHIESAMPARPGRRSTADHALTLQNLDAKRARLRALVERAGQLAGRKVKLGGTCARNALGHAVRLDGACECSPGKSGDTNGERLCDALHAATLPQSQGSDGLGAI